MPKKKNYIVTRDKLATMLREADDNKKAQIIGRALVRIMNRQTEDEKSNTNTRHTNMRGFAKPDARQGTLTAFYFLKHRTLLDWQVELWTRNFRGYPRICKYWKQLDEEAKKMKGVQ